jgi:hypothetical protein
VPSWPITGIALPFLPSFVFCYQKLVSQLVSERTYFKVWKNVKNGKYCLLLINKMLVLTVLCTFVNKCYKMYAHHGKAHHAQMLLFD